MEHSRNNDATRSISAISPAVTCEASAADQTRHPNRKRTLEFLRIDSSDGVYIHRMVVGVGVFL